ncbi:MAG TPA: hypothetical protein V6D07_03095 [Trichocoleus sp.]
MDFDEIINLVNETVLLVKGRPLTDVQRVVLKGSWDNETYTSMIHTVGVGYTDDYLKKDVGPKLWQLLSEVTGIPINKRNIRNALTQWAQRGPTEASPTPELPEDFSTDGVTVSVQPSLESASPRAEAGRTLRSLTQLAPCHILRIDVSEFSGRESDLAELVQAIEVEGCRLILLWGLPDIGKTALAVKVAEQVRSDFDLCGYLELTPDLSPDEFLAELAHWLGTAPDPSESWEAQVNWVVDQFAQRRCLLLIDNGEVLFEAGQLAGTYRTSCVPYHRFLERVAGLRHESCVLWISRERPPEFASLQGRLVRSRLIRDFSAAEAGVFLTAQGWPSASLETWQALVSCYGGSPRLLKSLTPILDMHGGNLCRMLEGEALLPQTEPRSLMQVLDRLSEPERELLYWLALAQEPVALQELSNSMVHLSTQVMVQSLLNRSLCFNSQPPDFADTVLDLNPVVRALAIERAVETLAAEIDSGQVTLFHRLPLLRVTAPEAVQSCQFKRVVQPLSQLLLSRYPTDSALTERIQQLHRTLRTHFLDVAGYGAGNLVHLCQSLGLSLSGFDFSRLVIWQANLQQVSLQGADLSYVQFQDTVFATALGRDPIVAFSQDGRNLAVGDHEGSLLHWEVGRGKLLRFLEDGNRQAVRCLAFSPEGDLLAVGSEDGRVQLWRLESTYELDLPLLGHASAVQALAFSPEGDLLATGDEQGCLYLWDLASGTQRLILAQVGEPIRAIQFSAQGDRLITCGEGQEACLWDVETGDLLKFFQVQPTAWIRTVGFIASSNELGPNSQDQIAFAAGYDDHCVYLWDVEAGQPRRIVLINTGAPPAMVVSPDGRYLAYSGSDRTVAILDVDSRDRTSVLPEFALPVWSLAFSPDSRLLVTGSDYTVKVWDVETGACLRSLWSQRYSLTCLTFDGTSKQLITGHDDTLLRTWQVSAAAGQITRPQGLKGHTGRIRAVAASADGRWLASSSDDRTLRLWNRHTGKCVRVLSEDLMTPATVMALSADGGWLVSGGEDSLVRVWSLTARDGSSDVVGQGAVSQPLAGHLRAISALALSPDSQYLASSSSDRTLRLWRLADGQCLQVMEGHQRQAHALSFSPDGQRLLSISRDGTARWWNVANGKCLGTWQHPQGYWLIGCMANDAGQLIAIAGDLMVLELWSVTENKQIRVLPGHTQAVWQACVSPDQRYLATASQDEEIRLWRLDLGTCVQVLHPDRPYEEVKIRGAKGLSEPEERMLRSLGAITGY